MILLMDNYDSFSYNLYQLIGKIEPDIRVIRNDACTPEEMEQMKPDALILSPGPGRPSDAGICEEAVLYFAGKIPILGVCLGHQAICEVFGGVVSYGKRCGFSKRYFLVLVACRHLTCTKTECRKMFLSLIAPLTTIRLNRGKRSNRLPYIFAQGQER